MITLIVNQDLIQQITKLIYITYELAIHAKVQQREINTEGLSNIGLALKRGKTSDYMNQ